MLTYVLIDDLIFLGEYIFDRERRSFLHLARAQLKMMIVKKPRDRLRDVRNISATGCDFMSNARSAQGARKALLL